MTPALLSLLMLAATAGLLVLDLTLGLFRYRVKRQGTGDGGFLRWWTHHSTFKMAVALLAMGFIAALYLHDHPLGLPNGRNLPRTAGVALFAILGLACFAAVDLIRSWRAFRADRRRSVGATNRFHRWWLRKSVLKLSLAGTLACLTVGGEWAVHRYKLLQPATATSEYMVSAMKYYGNRQYREAALELMNAIRRNPDDHEAYLWLARVSWQLGDLPAARRAYHEALGIDPELSPASLELGRLLFAMGMPEKALLEAEEALEASPRNTDLRLLLAQICGATGNRQRAVAEFRAVLDIVPDHPQARLQLIDLLLSHNAFREAGSEAEIGLRSKPEDTGLQVSRAIAREGEGRRAEAEAMLREAATRDKVSPLPLIALGDLLVRHREYLPALRSYEEALRRAPDEMIVMNNIAQLHAEHGYDLRRAAELASRAYSRHSDDPGVVDTLGWVLCRQGKVAEALPLLRQSAARLPQVPDARYHYGAALMLAGYRVEGRRELTAALKISGSFDGAAMARALLQQRAS